MAKKKKGSNKTGGNNTIKSMQSAVSDDEGDGGQGGLVEDEVDTWAREQDEQALAVLKRGSKGARKEETGRQEVLAMSGDSDSDLELPTARGLRRQEEGVEEEGDIREWGSRKKHYYGGNTGEDPESELDDSEMEEDRAEEVEVGRLQAKQLAAMEEEDFLDTFTLPEAKEEAKKPQPEVSALATDLSQLSRKEQAALFQQRAPEFQGVVADFQLRMGEAARLARVVVLQEGGQVPSGPQMEYVRSKLQLLLNYCTNIAAYLMFRAQGVSLTLHPVTGRLVQYRQLLDQLAPMDAVVMPGVEDLLKRMDMGEQVSTLVREEKRRARRAVEGGRRKQLSLLAEEQEQVVPEKKRKRKKQKSEGEALESLASLTHDERMAVELYNVIKKTKKNEDLEEEDSPDEDGLVESLQTADTAEKEATTNDAVEYDEEGEEKRAITYKIAKNKGLMPKRSKLQRNPRLKNRMKFEKATKRRKGAVREIRDQKSKYGGEASGVNVRVKKGVKLS